MAKRKRSMDKVKVTFLGNNASGVTGSSTLLEFRNIRIMLELGMYQEGTMLQNFQTNKSFLESVDFSKIDYVILCDSHVDHSGLLGYLGSAESKFEGVIIMTPNARRVTKHLLEDSAHIIKNDAEWLFKNRNMKVKEYYTKGDVHKMYEAVVEVPLGSLRKIEDNISMRYLVNSHNIGSASLELIFTESSGRRKKLFYSSDLGNVSQNMPFVASNLDHVKNADVAIFESTYGVKPEKKLTKSNRRFELMNLKREIVNTTINEGGVVICPVFAFQRSQQFLRHLKDIYDKTPELQNIPVVVDGRLLQNLNKEFLEMLEGEELESFKDIMEWDRLVPLSNYEETVAACNDPSPKIIVSSSGMASNGKVVAYLEKFVGKSNTLIVFNGYCSPNSLGHRLLEKLDNPEKSFIKIGDKIHHYRAKVMRMYTFSSHMQYDDLIEKASSMNVSKGYYLVHGSKESRESLAEGLIDALNWKNKTTPVKIVRKNYKIEF